MSEPALAADCARCAALCCVAPAFADFAIDKLIRLAGGSPAELAALDVAQIRRDVTPLLRDASRLARGDISPERDLTGADLIGGDLRGARLSRASLRGTLLIGADLTGADLNGADFTGADVRGARLHGADLGEALFLTQAQIDAARGDVRTRLPPALTGPAHWRDGSP